MAGRAAAWSIGAALNMVGARFHLARIGHRTQDRRAPGKTNPQNLLPQGLPMLCALLRSSIPWRCLAIGAALAAAVAGRPDAAEPSLPAYNADIARTSVSGVSSGAYMAVQFGTAWSSIVKGVGAIAGGPFGCSEGSESAALSTCMGGAPAADLAELIRRTDAWGRSGNIDETGNMAAQKIYLFSGYNDNVVARSVSDSLRGYYAHYLGRNMGNLFYQTAIGAGHSQVTIAYGGKCNENGGEYINRCNYDQAGVILQHIYGALTPRNTGSLTGRLLTFSQADFTAPDQPMQFSMDDKGFVYVPASCAAMAPCSVHVVLHGCLQSFGNIGDDFVMHAGYNEWADANHIIVLYPQIHALEVVNPQGCWDWWGYLDANPTQSPTYLLKSGKQITAIKAMVDHVTGGASASAVRAASQPAAPAAVFTPDRTDSAIDVVWSSVPGVTSFDVFRTGPGDTDFRQIGTVSGLSYGDAGLKPATPYQYEVRASSPAGAGPFSSVVSATTLRRVPPCDDPGSCVVHRVPGG
jgi:Esterase PHB depolymerase